MRVKMFENKGFIKTDLGVIIFIGGMNMFNLFKKNENTNFDISNVSNNNVNEFLKSGQLKLVYLISPDFGGSEARDNQVVVTPKAYNEKQQIDDELYGFLVQKKSVKKFNVNLKYKGNSIVPSEIIVSANIDGNDYKKIIEVW
jgi:hypothetical protein